MARPLGDWMENPELLEEPQVVLPYVAVEGRVTLFSGREKIGKSSLVGGAVAQASRGDPVLGTPVLGMVKSLVYSIDELVGDTVRRFAMSGGDMEMIVINDRPRTVAELIAHAIVDIKTHDPDLVVVDTLSRVLDNSGVDRNVAKDVGPAMNRIVDLLHDSAVSGALLYHTGKAGREYSGNTAIGATVDEILTLRRRGSSDEDDFDDDGSDDGRRLLVQDGRNLRGRVHLTYVNGVYQLYQETTAPREKVLEVLHTHGPVIGRSELAKLAGVRKATGLEVIAELIGGGFIVENQRRLSLGSRQFPQGGTTMEPTPGTNRDGGAFTGSRFGNPHPAALGTGQFDEEEL